MTEIPSETPLIDTTPGATQPIVDRAVTPVETATEADLLGEVVFFVTQRGAWPGMVVSYDATTKRLRMQVCRKKADGSDLSTPIRHISTGDVPCWAWKHETPFGGIQSEQPPPRAHGRFDPGGIRV